MLGEGTGVMVAKLEEDSTFLELSSPVFLPPIREDVALEPHSHSPKFGYRKNDADGAMDTIHHADGIPLPSAALSTELCGFEGLGWTVNGVNQFSSIADAQGFLAGYRFAYCDRVESRPCL